MMAFQYSAIDQNGKQHKGIVQADNDRQVRYQLREKGLITLEVKSVVEKEKTLKKLDFLKVKKLKAQDLALMTRQMATLLAAGIPLDEVLQSVANQNSKPAIKKIMLGVRAKVMEGYTLSAGMNDFPHAFPKLYRTTIGAGEKSGKLEQVLVRLAEYTEKQLQIKRKILQALIYPLLMTLVSIAVVAFMLIYIVPKIIDVFTETNQTLPFSTQILIFISHGLKEYGFYLIGGLIVLGYGFFRANRRNSFRCRVHQILLKIPLLGKTIQTINSARFARTFGILTAASVPVLEAMRASAQLIMPLPMQAAVMNAIEQVREGIHIYLALEKTGYFSPMFIHLIASGESSGQLEAMLQKAAAQQEADVEAIIESSLTLFEPVMILVMGGVVMFIVLAIMLPIFALDNFNG